MDQTTIFLLILSIDRDLIIIVSFFPKQLRCKMCVCAFSKIYTRKYLNVIIIKIFLILFILSLHSIILCKNANINVTNITNFKLLIYT